MNLFRLKFSQGQLLTGDAFVCLDCFLHSFHIHPHCHPPNRSEESYYAIEWAIGTVLRNGDELLYVTVMETDSKREWPMQCRSLVVIRRGRGQGDCTASGCWS